MQQQPWQDQPPNNTLAWETIPGEKVCESWGVDPVLGLSTDQVVARQKQLGLNRLGETARPSAFFIFIRQFQSAVVLLLLAATLVSWYLGELLDAAAIFGALLINAAIGFVIEYQASNSLAALQELAVLNARCLRDGQEEPIPTPELVPGDIVLLEGGDRVPADGRILKADRLLVDESQLTGESFPVEKNSEVLSEKHPLAERHNTLFLGSSVLEGTAKIVITETGPRTELGKIGRLLAETSTEIPLEARLNQLGNHLLLIVGVLSVGITLLGILHGESLGHMLETGIVMAIAAVPEGLPVVATIALAVGMQRMVQRRVLIRQLASVETLGSVTEICSDKTGTMTQNIMTVQHLQTPDAGFTFEGLGYDPVGAVIGEPREALRQPLLTAVLANDATLEFSTAWHVHGDPSEGALLVAAQKAGIQRAELAKTHQRLYALPFESRRKRMSVICQTEGQKTAYSKGALETILATCDRLLDSRGIRPLTPQDIQHIHSQAQTLVAEGLRLLALAYKPLPDEEDPEQGMIYTGLVAMRDPPKAGVRQALQACREAGIRVRMITGDHPDTARAIARDLHLTDHREPVITVDPQPGEDLTEADIFARTTSEAKLLIVQALKQKGAIVAMTGDGVNDAPALKKADIGVAMNAGSDVAKEAAAMVLMDNDFSSIVEAIREGRIIYANIRRATMFLLTASFSVMALIVMAIVGNWGLPLLPLQILWQNLLLHVFPALGLAFQPGESNEMHRPPNPPHEPLLNRRVIGSILTGCALVAGTSLAAYLWGISQHGIGAEASSLALGSLVASLLAWAVVSHSERPFKTPSNPALGIALAVVIVLQGLAFYLPALNGILKTMPLSLPDLAVLSAAALLVWILGEALKSLAWGQACKPPGEGSLG